MNNFWTTSGVQVYFEKQALPPTGKVMNTIYPSLQKKKIPSF